MQFIRKNSFFLLAGLAYLVLSLYFIWQDQAYLSLFPSGLMAIYFAIYYSEWAFLSIAFLTPLSINIEDWTDSFGLFVPTEPLLFGFMLLFIMLQLRKPIIQPEIWKNPIIWAVGFYLFWIFIFILFNFRSD